MKSAAGVQPGRPHRSRTSLPRTACTASSRSRVVATSGGAARILTRSLDRWVNQVRFSADGQWIYFSYEQLGGVDLARVRVTDGKLEDVLAGERRSTRSNVARNGAIAALVQNMNDPAEIYSFTRGQRPQAERHQ